MEPDKSLTTFTDTLEGTPWDLHHVPLPTPQNSPWIGLQYRLCMSGEWWVHVASLLNRLQYADAWDDSDEQHVADVIQWVTQIIAIINRRDNCMPTPISCCDCQTEITNIVNKYIDNNYYNDSLTNIYNQWDVTYFQENNIPGDKLGDQIGGDIVTREKICQAALSFMIYMHDIGEITSKGLIENSKAFGVIRTTSDILSLISSGVGFASLFIPILAPVAAAATVTAAVTAIFDDAVLEAAVVLMGEQSLDDLKTYACKLANCMRTPGSDYFTFASCDFGNTLFNDLWADIATLPMYLTFQMLLENPPIKECSCPETCINIFAAQADTIFNGVWNPTFLYPFLYFDGKLAAGGDNLIINCRVDLPYPAVVKYASMTCIAARYSNTGFGYGINIRTDTIPTGDCIKEDGATWVPADMAEFHEWRAPASVVGGSKPQSNNVTFTFDFGQCTLCDPAQRALFETAWGYMMTLTICYE